MPKNLWTTLNPKKNSLKKSSKELLILELSNLKQIIFRVIVVGGTIADICMHYCEKYQLMIIKVLSKFELKRLCKAVGATALTRLGAPTLEELGTADEVFVQEIGS